MIKKIFKKILYYIKNFEEIEDFPFYIRWPIFVILMIFLIALPAVLIYLCIYGICLYFSLVYKFIEYVTSTSDQKIIVLIILISHISIPVVLGIVGFLLHIRKEIKNEELEIIYSTKKNGMKNKKGNLSIINDNGKLSICDNEGGELTIKDE